MNNNLTHEYVKIIHRNTLEESFYEIIRENNFLKRNWSNLKRRRYGAIRKQLRYNLNLSVKEYKIVFIKKNER